MIAVVEESAPSKCTGADLSLAREVHMKWLAAMRAGDLEEAWRQTDRLELERRTTGIYQSECHLLWDGTDFSSRRVLVRCNHGLGDTIQFARFVPIIAHKANSVTVLAQPSLVPLLQCIPGIDVRDGWSPEPPPPHDALIEVMELAYACRATAATLPRTPYFDTGLIRSRSSVHLSSEPRGSLRVGLIWAASSWDPSRSISCEALAPLREVEAEFFSFQQGPEAEDWLRLPLPANPASRQTRAILDAAAAMLDLDLLVTVDTMAAHLAAALDVPVALLLKHEADWRWGCGATTPWYQKMRIFRQQTAGDWAAPIDELVRWISSTRLEPEAGERHQARELHTTTSHP